MSVIKRQLVKIPPYGDLKTKGKKGKNERRKKEDDGKTIINNKNKCTQIWRDLTHEFLKIMSWTQTKDGYDEFCCTFLCASLNMMSKR